jgi:hypothetical protein
MQAMGFLNRLCSKSWGIPELEQKSAENNDRAANRAVYL